MLESINRTFVVISTVWNASLQIIGHIWTFPNTLLGLLLGLASSIKPSVHQCVLEFYVTRGPVKLVCDSLCISAFTLGDTVLYVVPPTGNLRAHEGRHIIQYHLLGPLFLPVYFIMMALYGYHNHPMEQDARRHEERVCGFINQSNIGRDPEQKRPQSIFRSGD